MSKKNNENWDYRDNCRLEDVVRPKWESSWKRIPLSNECARCDELYHLTRHYISCWWADLSYREQEIFRVKQMVWEGRKLTLQFYSPCTCDMHYKPYRKSDQEIRDEGEKNE